MGRFPVFALFAALATVASAAGAGADARAPTESVAHKSDREKYSRHLRASLEGQLDVVHDELSKVLSFEHHTIKVDPESRPRVLREDRDMSPLAAGTPEDRLLRELKETHKLVSPDTAPKDEAYGLGERRPDGEPYKVAPRSLDPHYDQQVAAAMGMGMKPAGVPTSLFHGKLSAKPHYSSEDPGRLLFGAEDREAARVAKAAEPLSEASKAAAAIAKVNAGKGRKDPSAKGPLPTDPAAAEIALGISSQESSAPAAAVNPLQGALAASLSADQDAAASVFGIVPLFEFHSDEMRDHFLTTERALAATDGVDQWKDRRELCRVYKDAAPATVPLYLLWDKSTLDHRYSIKASPPAGYRNDGVVAHVYPQHVPGSVALHEFYEPNAHDHLYAVDPRELRARQARGEVTYAGVACYVLPTRSAAAQTMSTSALLSEISRLSTETDVLASRETIEDSELAAGGPAWAKPNAGRDRSMMSSLASDPAQPSSPSTTLVSEPKAKTRSSKTTNEANESSEPESVPEVTESAREEVAADQAPTVTGPPPNELVVDQTAAGARVPRVVAMYEYFNPQIRDHYYTTNYDILADGMADWKLIGPRYWVFDTPEFNTVPLYRYWSLENGDHYYTLEKFTSREYKYTGIAGYVFAKASKDNVPLYRYYSRDTGDHLYTLRRQDDKRKALGFAYEGIQCYVFDSAKDNLLPQDLRSSPGVLANFYRYYNSETRHHFYTTSTRELEGDMLAHGWNSEGVAGRIHIYPQSGMVPLRRYWNVRSLTHYYSTRWLKLKGGWSYDGIQGYVSDKLVKGTVPLYRFYNPSNDDDIYTIDRKEVRGRSDRDQWVFKGVTCYVNSVEDEAPANVYRYYNPKAADYFYTTDRTMFGAGKDGWVLQKAAFGAFREGVRGTIPVHAYYHPTNFDHLLTAKYFPNRKDGWVYRGVAFYAYPDDAASGAGSKLYRFYNPESKTHYYTADPGEAAETRPGTYAVAGQDGWFFYGTTAVVLDPQPAEEDGLNSPVPVYGFLNRAKQLSAFSVNPKFKAQGFAATGAAFRAWAGKLPGLAPVYRYYNEKTKVFSFSSLRLSGDILDGRGEYNGVAVWVSKRAREGSVPLYIFKSKTGMTSLTIDPSTNKGWTFDGIAGYVFPKDGASVSAPQPVYQYYSPSRTEHFYTINWGLMGHGRDGWQLQGSPFMALAYKGESRVATYDHYDGNGKLHTLSTSPRMASDTKTPTIAFYLGAKSLAKGMVPLYEYANMAVTDHVYTVDASVFAKGKDSKGKATLTYGGVPGWVRSAKPLGYAFPPEKRAVGASVPDGTRAVYSSQEKRDQAPSLGFVRSSTAQRPAFFAYGDASANKAAVPLYSYTNDKDGDRLYTTKWFKPAKGWAGGEVAMYVLPKKAGAAVPLYRFNNRDAKRHLYTTSLDGMIAKDVEVTGPKGKKFKAKRWTSRGTKGLWRYEGVQAYVFAPPSPRLPVFELYNPKAGKHMYTASVSSIPQGWRNLGAKFFTFTSAAPGASAMKEYVNKKTGERTLARGSVKVPAGTIQSPKPAFYLYPKPGSGRVALHWYRNPTVNDNVYILDQRLMKPSKIKGSWKFLDDGTDGWKYQGAAGFVWAPPRSTGVIR